MKFNKTLIAVLSSCALGGFPTISPAEEKIPSAPGRSAEYFYTGKSYDVDLGAYTFQFRNYDPGLKRWTSVDPSGFPDGANNQIYVNNLVLSSVERLGLDIYQVTNSGAVGGAGHSGMIAGSGDSYTYQSYGSGPSGCGSSSGTDSNNVTTETFGSLNDAMQYAAGQGYDNYCKWDTDPSADQAALDAMKDYGNSANYDVGNHNCQDAVNAGLDAANADHSPNNIPNVNMNDNIKYMFADDHGKVSDLE